MIQRLQTVLLFLAAVVNVSILFAPFWYFANTNLHLPEERTATLMGSEIKLQVMSMETGDWATQTLPMGDQPLVIVHIAMVALTTLEILLAIFLFKKRPLQLKVAYAALLSTLIQTIVIVLQSQQLGALTGEVAEGQFDEGPSWGYAIPILTLMLVWWATRRIRKDERLVKSMDRLR